VGQTEPLDPKRPSGAYFGDTPYSPREPNDLTETEGPVLERFLAAAKERGLRTCIQTSAAQPPGLREQDVPKLPDGRIPKGRLAETGSLASDAIRSYNRAFVRDSFEHYLMIDGIRPDWPEYPCYTLGEAFQDFGDHVGAWAGRHGFDFERMQREVAPSTATSMGD